MSIVVLNNIKKGFGAQDVISSCSADINRGNPIGLVGRNGAGKTTLLKMIAGSEKPNDGHISFSPGIKIGYLQQDPQYPEGRTLYEEVREGIAALDELENELRDLEVQLADPLIQQHESNYQKLLDRYSNTQDKYDQRDGWRADARVEAILNGLKVPDEDWNRDLSTFSGGERNIIGLARLLVQDPDLMLLDEPGNHLDFEGLDWLENELKRFKGAILLVSHNRYLLDSVCRSIWEIEGGEVEKYAGNYSAYRAEKLLRMEKAEAMQKRQDREKERLMFQIQRLKSWASVYDNPKLARTAKRFERRIEKMETPNGPREDKRKIGLTLGTGKTRGNIALDVIKYSKQFDKNDPLFTNVSFGIRQGERVALVGPNGTGKSTLLKDVYYDGRWENEILRVGKAMKIGYLSQMGEELNRDNDLVTELMRLADLRRNEAESLLYRFLFRRDDHTKPVSVLSGGERVRLQLAALMAGGANFLLLDEPTNHLDIYSREAVEDALEEYAGTIMVVSHDRYFLDKIARRIVYVQTPKIEPFEGNFSEFWESWRDQKLLKEMEKEEILKKEKANEEQSLKNKQKKIKFNAKRFVFLEEEIHRLEAQIERLNEEIEKEVEKGNKKREMIKKDKRDKNQSELEIIYDEWFIMGDKKKSL